MLSYLDFIKIKSLWFKSDLKSKSNNRKIVKVKTNNSTTIKKGNNKKKTTKLPFQAKVFHSFNVFVYNSFLLYQQTSPIEFIYHKYWPNHTTEGRIYFENKNINLKFYIVGGCYWTSAIFFPFRRWCHRTFWHKGRF